jgi:formate dehydrogenase subunit delta
VNRMAMSQSLVSMANQIGDFFRFQGDEKAAMQSIAAHLRQFWAPSMRRDLVECLDLDDAAGMRPLVKSALMAHRRQLLERAEERAEVLQGQDALEGPSGGGDAG